MSKLKILRKEELKNKIAVLMGTRPSIIKMSPLIQELSKHKCQYILIHAGQHYSYNMNNIFFKEINLPDPDYVLESVKNYELHGAQTAEMLKGIEKILLKEKPKILLVCGDANYNLAGAIAARKLGIFVGHVESGLRSDDWRMPEEHNRIMIDHISDFLFTPTEVTEHNLIADNVKGEIYTVGNTVVDAVYQNIRLAEKKSKILVELELTSEKYFLLTIHREENVDFEHILEKILNGVNKISEFYPNYPIIFPIHPRTKKRIKEFNLSDILKNKNVKIIDPIGYLDFLMLLLNAELVLTDSGGIQEEACILKIPCITLRENTERQETLDIGANILAGHDLNTLTILVGKMLESPRDWINPYGDGKTAEKIIKVILKEM
jgi:UDP-N-acetylglucosamine 2-epimerase (non-hydrolysing)